MRSRSLDVPIWNPKGEFFPLQSIFFNKLNSSYNVYLCHRLHPFRPLIPEGAWTSSQRVRAQATRWRDLMPIKKHDHKRTPISAPTFHLRGSRSPRHLRFKPRRSDLSSSNLASVQQTEVKAIVARLQELQRERLHGLDPVPSLEEIALIGQAYDENWGAEVMLYV